MPGRGRSWVVTGTRVSIIQRPEVAGPELNRGGFTGCIDDFMVGSQPSFCRAEIRIGLAGASSERRISRGAQCRRRKRGPKQKTRHRRSPEPAPHREASAAIAGTRLRQQPSRASPLRRSVQPRSPSWGAATRPGPMQAGPFPYLRQTCAALVFARAQREAGSVQPSWPQPLRPHFPADHLMPLTIIDIES